MNKEEDRYLKIVSPELLGTDAADFDEFLQTINDYLKDRYRVIDVLNKDGSRINIGLRAVETDKHGTSLYERDTLKLKQSEINALSNENEKLNNKITTLLSKLALKEQENEKQK